MSNFGEIWKFMGPVVGAILGFFGNYFLERRRERRKKAESLQVVECVELVNTKVLDKESLGPIASNIQIKSPKAGTGSEIIDVNTIHFARFRLRNLSDTPIDRFFVSSKNSPGSIWFSVTEGENCSSPEWKREFGKMIEQEKVSNERGWERFPIPYLNPYSAAGHEVFIDLSSYLPLDGVEIAGGAKGVKFVFEKYKG